MKYRSVVFFVNLFVLITISNGDKRTNTASTRYTEAEHELVRKRRKFGSEGPPCDMTHGVYLERWDRIDYKRVKFLLSDSRYPNLPSLTLCVPTFEQPQKWADFFGARMRTYFVPDQSGDYLFFLSSNAGSELYISTNETAAGRTRICLVDGGFPSEPYEYDRYATQRSLPIDLIKGKFYYMESIMKDDHQYDHLEVAMQAPDGTFYKVIPSAFLWTVYKKSYAMNATYQAIFLKVAAEAGAKAGLSLGAKFAMRSGASAGAKAGAKAGMQSGASAGAVAGVRAAIKMTTTALEDALNSLHGDSAHKYKINVEGGEVVSVTGPGMDGSNGAAVSETSAAAAVAGSAGTAGGVSGGTRSAAAAAAAAGAASVGGVLGSLVNRSTGLGGAAAGGGGRGGGGGGVAAVGGGGGGGGAGGTAGEATGGAAGSAAGGAAGGATGGAGGGAVEGAAGATAEGAAGATDGGQSGVTGSSSASTSGGGEGAVKPGYTVPGGRGVVSVGGRFITELTYTPKPGEDPQIKAKELVWKAGGARIIVANAMYTFHSFNIPDPQEDFSLNQCWKSHRGDLVLDMWCNVFIARIPSFSPKAGTPSHTVSFESACFPGYFIRQKNFRFILQKRDGSDVFDRDSSFHIFDVMRYSQNFLFRSTHEDWYICQSPKKKEFGTSIILDYYNGEPDVLDRCTFVLSPIFKNPLQHCKDALGPVKEPQINGQPLPHPSGLIQHTPAPPFVLPSCMPVCPSGAKETMWAMGTNAQGASGTSESAVEIPSASRASKSSKKMCVALNVINKFGPPFKLFSSLKNEGYLATGPGFRLKLIVDSPTLHKNLIFYAKDPDGKRTILLNGTPTLSEPVTLGCPDFANVIVSGEQGPPFPPNRTTLSPAIPPVHGPRTAPVPGQAHGPGTSSSKSGSAHLHYHYHSSKMTGRNQACPSNCGSVGECGPPCPERCCKRDVDESDDVPD